MQFQNFLSQNTKKMPIKNNTDMIGSQLKKIKESYFKLFIHFSIRFFDIFN